MHSSNTVLNNVLPSSEAYPDLRKVPSHRGEDCNHDKQTTSLHYRQVAGLCLQCQVCWLTRLYPLPLHAGESVQAPFKRKTKALTDAINCNHQGLSSPKQTTSRKSGCTKRELGLKDPVTALFKSTPAGRLCSSSAHQPVKFYAPSSSLSVTKATNYYLLDETNSITT